MNRSGIWRIAAALSLAAGIAHAQSLPVTVTVRQFVQKFYDWYVPLTVSSKNAPAWDVMLAKSRPFLSPELYAALKADDDAQKKVPGEVVGLDFDPFLNSQDPDNRYTAGAVIAHGATFLVEIRGAHSKEKQPDVIAEVAQSDGRWHFVDFLYPGSGDLLSVLKDLARERAHPAPPAR